MLNGCCVRVHTYAAGESGIALAALQMKVVRSTHRGDGERWRKKTSERVRRFILSHVWYQDNTLKTAICFPCIQ